MKNKNPKIIAFSCNWAPYACLDKLGQLGLSYPTGINVIHVTCAGRINTSHIIKSFQYGADGVMIMHCREGYCNYGAGPEYVNGHIDKAREILRLLGIEEERFVHLSYSSDEYEKMREDLNDFHSTICNLKSFDAKYRNVNKTG